MKRNRVPLWILAFLLSNAALPAQADISDELQDAAANALQKLDQFAIKESALCNKGVEDLLSKLDTAQRGSVPIDANAPPS